MTRLTVTFEDAAASALDNPPVADWAAVIDEASSVLSVEEEATIRRLRESLRALGPDPSASAVVREAVDLYLDLFREARQMVALQAGYEALAGDAERKAVVESLSRRAPSRWANEP